MSNALGNSKVRQESIDEKVDTQQIKNLYLSKLNEFEKIVNETDDHFF